MSNLVLLALLLSNGSYNLTLTVTDKDGGVTTQTVEVIVDNVAPTIAAITKPSQINEGQSIAFSTTATDPGINDTLTYNINTSQGNQWCLSFINVVVSPATQPLRSSGCDARM